VRELLGAVDSGNAGGVKHVLQEPGVMVNGTNKHGESPLHIAAGYGYMHITRMLLDSGANMDQKDKHGDTPLYWASRHGHLDMVKYLVAKGAMLDLQDKAEETALHVAARYGHPEVVTFLCQSGASLDIQDKDGETPIHCASWHGFQPIVECLVHYGCSLDVMNKDQETALHIAAVRGYCNIVKLLCQSKCNVNKQDKNGCTAVHLATRRNHLDIVQYLCSIKANIDLKDKLEESPLHDASRDGNLPLVQTLYAAGCNLNIPNKKNKATPLHLAAKYGHIEVVRCLCAAGCDLEAVTEQGYSADEVASGASHETTATLIHSLRINNTRDLYVSEMSPAGAPVSKVKLLVCGGAGVGKTELVSSLRCGRLKSLFRRRSASDLAHMVSHRTYGFNVLQCAIPGAGDFSIWDFSGRKNYYLGHENFLVCANSIFIVVFSLRDPIDRQVAQVRHWLRIIRAKQHTNRGSNGLANHKPTVVLVGSFADQQQPVLESVPSEFSNGQVFAVPSAASVMNPHIDNGKSILSTVSKEFGHLFSFPEYVHTLDCRLSQTKEIRGLRSFLGVVKADLHKVRCFCACSL
jgi:death-associated protein kinase